MTLAWTGPRHLIVLKQAFAPGGKLGHPMPLRSASCSCRQLRLTVSAEPVCVSICHCLACQRRTGSAFGTQARFPKESVQITRQSSAYVRIGDSGNKLTFHFCPVCGSTVHYELKGQEDRVAVPVGAFADPDFPVPTFSVYESRMHAWVGLPVSIEHDL
jgi:hypothetical protein